MSHFPPFSVEIKTINRGRLLAIATVIFNEVVESKGWRIMKSNFSHPRFHRKIWIQPPSYTNSQGERGHQTYINSKQLYEEIENEIYRKYHEKSIPGPNPTLDSDPY
jgi:hypothetical protein